MDVSTPEQTVAFSDTVWDGDCDVPRAPRDSAADYVATERRLNQSARKTGVAIAGLATAVPPRSISQEKAGEFAAALMHGRRGKTVPLLYRRSGVNSRHSVLLEEGPDDEVRQSFYQPPVNEQDRGPTTVERMRRFEFEAPELGERASLAALRDADVSPENVTHLVTVSCSGFFAPGMDLVLIPRLGLDPQIARTNVGFMGCHGLMNGLRTASAICGSNPEATVLVCAVELCSLHHQYTNDPQQIVANALFGDGAAAIVVRGCNGESPGWKLHDQRSLVLPETEELMSWRIGDYGFQMTLSPRVPDVIRANLRPWLTEWLSEHALQIDDIAAWAVHPGGPRILQATAEGAGFAPSLLRPSQDVLADYGNMSSPTVAFILERLMQTGAAGPCMMLTFGPGLTIEAGLLMSVE